MSNVMKEKPILFNSQMVRAILEGRKTQTRRIMKPQPVHEKGFWKWASCMWSDSIKKVTPVYGHTMYTHAPYHLGDRLWVRETFSRHPERAIVAYRADGEEFEDGDGWWEPIWTPSIHMPRAYSRITLEVTDVRAERIQDISEEDVLKEGIEVSLHGGKQKYFYPEPESVNKIKGYWESDAIYAYSGLWNTIYGQGSWESNPWVWAICFKIKEVTKEKRE